MTRQELHTQRSGPATSRTPMDSGRVVPVGESARRTGVDRAVQTDSTCTQPPGGEQKHEPLCLHTIPRKRSCLWIDRLLVVQFVWSSPSSSFAQSNREQVAHCGESCNRSPSPTVASVAPSWSLSSCCSSCRPRIRDTRRGRRTAKNQVVVAYCSGQIPAFNDREIRVTVQNSLKTYS